MTDGDQQHLVDALDGALRAVAARYPTADAPGAR
jgi:hypothetical protein